MSLCLSLFLKLKMSFYVNGIFACTCVCVLCAQSPWRRGHQTPETGAMGGCELLCVGAKNRTMVLCRGRRSSVRTPLPTEHLSSPMLCPLEGRTEYTRVIFLQDSGWSPENCSENYISHRAVSHHVGDEEIACEDTAL